MLALFFDVCFADLVEFYDIIIIGFKNAQKLNFLLLLNYWKQLRCIILSNCNKVSQTSIWLLLSNF